MDKQTTDNYLIIKKATRNISMDGNEWINPDDIKAINDAAFNMAEEIRRLQEYEWMYKDLCE